METNSQKPKSNRPQNVVIENRRKAQLSGIQEVVSFSEQAIVLQSYEGMISIAGNELKITAFSVEDGVFAVEGTIDGLRYLAAQEKKPLLKRLLK